MSYNKPLSFFDKICDDDEKQEKANTFCLYHRNFQFCEIATERENIILPMIYAAYDFWHYYNQLIKYTLEELRKLIPTIQDWHLLYYLMYKHEWDEDVINYKFKKICSIEKERINKIKLLDETLKYMTPLNPDYKNLIIQHSQLISSLV